jgi:holliday junction DNA helicase RuvB
MLTNPLRDRFRHRRPAGVLLGEELGFIVHRSAGLLQMNLEEAGALEIAKRSRAARRASPTACCGGCATTPK